MLIESLTKWVGKCVYVCQVVEQFLSSPLCALHFSVGCSARELIVTETHTPASICGSLVAHVCVALCLGLCEAEGRMFKLSRDK